jgi:hypothetical protein
MRVYGELFSAQLENLSSAPATGKAGRAWYRTDLQSVQYDNGSSVKTLLTTDYTPPTMDPPKNWVINGNFDFWQRGISVIGFSSASSPYLADRFGMYITGSTATVDLSRFDGTIPTSAQAGFRAASSYGLVVNTADAAVAAGDNVVISTRLEGYTWAALEGNQCTLSFWVRAFKTGIYCVSFRAGTDRTYIAEYTVSASDTWEKKVITLTMNPVGGTLNYTTGIGLHIRWALMAGTTYQGTAGSWLTGGTVVATANQVNAMDSTSNSFYLALVKLEINSTATAFTRCGGDVSTELLLCQRYFEKSFNVDFTPAPTNDGAVYQRASSTAHTVPISFKVTKRLGSAVTVTLYNPSTGGTGTWRDSSAAADRVAAAANIGDSNFRVDCTATVDTNMMLGHWAASCEL